MWRRSRRSATTPPIIVKRRIGSSLRKVSSPRKNADREPAIVRISHACATFCIHVPILDVRAPIQRRRKLRWPSAAAIRPAAVGITSCKRDGEWRWQANSQTDVWISSRTTMSTHADIVGGRFFNVNGR